MAALIRFYVAGKFADMHRINALVCRLALSQSQRLAVTHNWAAYAIKNSSLSTGKAFAGPDEWKASMQVDAVLDIQGVRDADIVLALLDDSAYPYRGTWTEIGAALGMNKPVIIVNPGGDAAPIAQNVFYWFPTVQHAASIDEGVTLVYKFAAAAEAAAAVVAEAAVASASAASFP